MECVMCGQVVISADHIAIDEHGDPVVMCSECYEKAKVFFEDGKNR